MKKVIIKIAAISLTVLGHLDSAGQSDKPPYLSPVPKFTFAKTLAEQEQQLKTNTLMLRFAESRKNLFKDAGDQITL